MMLWFIGLLAVAATWFGVMPLYFGRIPGFSKALTLTVKTIPTASAALFALAAFLQSGGADRYALLIFIGLCVCAAADYLLGVKFIVGGALAICFISRRWADCARQTAGAHYSLPYRLQDCGCSAGGIFICFPANCCIWGCWCTAVR